MDSLRKKVWHDRSKINMHEAHEVKYWSKALGVTRDELQRSVDKVGNSAAAVRKELASSAAGDRTAAVCCLARSLKLSAAAAT